MKKYIICALAIMATMISCNNASPKMDDKPAIAGSDSTQGLKIAFIEVDSLMTQYNFAKDYSASLEKKSNNARNTLAQKGNQLQAAVNNFQQKLNNNGFQSREQAAGVQAAIERQQRDLQELQARLETELAKFNEALRDSLSNFLAAYIADKHYDMVLSKAGDNILWAEKRFDITQDVINGLNKRYKPAAKKADSKKTDDKNEKK